MALNVEAEASKFVMVEKDSSPSKADAAAVLNLNEFVREFISMSMAVARERDRLIVEVEVGIVRLEFWGKGYIGFGSIWGLYPFSRLWYV